VTSFWYEILSQAIHCPERGRHRADSEREKRLETDDCDDDVGDRDGECVSAQEFLSHDQMGRNGSSVRNATVGCMKTALFAPRAAEIYNFGLWCVKS
jgi:hypothetical protein